MKIKSLFLPELSFSFPGSRCLIMRLLLNYHHIQLSLQQGQLTLSQLSFLLLNILLINTSSIRFYHIQLSLQQGQLTLSQLSFLLLNILLNQILSCLVFSQFFQHFSMRLQCIEHHCTIIFSHLRVLRDYVMFK